ncbi:hypothetical protein [Chryseobacterium sp.]|uniref:hypothetical protein n=1 Tax=Chryseobacterium sp. TaxID=1871047 RepID=UPI00289C2D03|nr:hypothetical protein [Chryseobacterium sp.]
MKKEDGQFDRKILNLAVRNDCFLFNLLKTYQKVSRALIDLLEIFNIGGQKPKKFIDDLWKKIAEWFKKNKEILH